MDTKGEPAPAFLATDVTLRPAGSERILKMH